MYLGELYLEWNQKDRALEYLTRINRKKVPKMPKVC